MGVRICDFDCYRSFCFINHFSSYIFFTKDNPGRTKISLAANRAIARQSGQGVKDLVIDSSEIAREVGIPKVEIVRKLLALPTWLCEVQSQEA
jgi:hypothetical protein